ncbi:hypothetical protein TWF481_011319 [Arthrobotrys musiformis]|uniref:F-box domain-containing protein n=1 Tax=Arthrobotrys musiformis TaxID=47236 RepID=A0AAV9VZU5_9PEZI
MASAYASSLYSSSPAPEDQVFRLPDLPPELIISVIRHMSRKSLSQLCLTSRGFLSYCQPLLYETVDLRLRKDLGLDPCHSQALLSQNHTGLEYVKHFIVSGEVSWELPGGLSGEASEVVSISGPAYVSLQQFQDQSILCILRNIPRNKLRSFIWSTNVEMSFYITEELCKNQQRLEGFWAPRNDSCVDGKVLLDFSDLSLKWKLKHIHIIDISRSPWLEFIFRMIRMSATSLETLSLEFSDVFLDFLREELVDISGLGSEIPQLDYYEASWGTIAATQLGMDFTTAELQPATDNAPLAPLLRYLSLRGFDESFFTEFPWLRKAIDFTRLEVLKVKDSGDMPSLGRCLLDGQLRLTTFHLFRSINEAQIVEILISFNGLEELVLEGKCEDAGRMALAISNHKNSLRRLYWHPTSNNGRIEVAPDMRSSFFGGLEHLIELAISSSLASFRQKQMSNLKFIWLLRKYDGPVHLEQENAFASKAFKIFRRLDYLLVGQKEIFNLKEKMRRVMRRPGRIHSVEQNFGHVSKERGKYYKLLRLDIPWMPTGIDR